MSLTVMLATDEDAFFCDMVETYHITDYRALPVETLAVLAFGLRENSRIKLKIAGINPVPVEIILPQIYDILVCLGAGLSGAKEAPPSMMDLVRGVQKEEDTVDSFNTPEEFQAEWNRRIQGD